MATKKMTARRGATVTRASVRAYLTRTEIPAAIKHETFACTKQEAEWYLRGWKGRTESVREHLSAMPGRAKKRAGGL